MAVYVALNNAYSTLAAGLGSLITDTIVTVQTGHGARFAVGTEYTYATLEAANGNVEIIKITAQSGDALTVVRGQDGTSRLAWNIGDIIEVRPCKVAMEAIAADTLTSAKAATHAATGKTTPDDADEFTLIDSVAGAWTFKKLTWVNIKATAKTYFDSLYAKVGLIASSGLTMNTAKLLGRTTAATGAVEEIAVGTGLSLSAGALTCTVTSPVSSVVGQTGAVTTAQVMAAIQTVDGPGSGLDADLLDGLHASAFAAASHGTHLTAIHAGINAVVAAGATTSAGTIVVNSYGQVTSFTPADVTASGGGACVHPHSNILMADGSLKWAVDIRPGDVIVTDTGAAAVTGIWESVLGDRPLIEVNEHPVLTPDHLVKTPSGWAAYDPAMYAELDAGKTRSVKTKLGMRDISAGAIDPADVAQLVIGSEILTPAGPVMVTSIREINLNQAYQPVLSIATENGSFFYCDGYAVAAL